MRTPFRVFVALVLLLLCQLVHAVTFECVPSRLGIPGVYPGTITGDQSTPYVVWTGVGVTAFWYCSVPVNGKPEIHWQNWHATYKYLGVKQQNGTIVWPEGYVATFMRSYSALSRKTPRVDCTKIDTIADDDERQLCADTLYYVRKNWPTVTTK